MGYGVNGAGKDAVWVLRTSRRTLSVPEDLSEKGTTLKLAKFQQA